MYNTDILPQTEQSRKYLFGNKTDSEIEESSRRYAPPENAKIVPCEENERGEWIPRKVEE